MNAFTQRLDRARYMFAAGKATAPSGEGARDVQRGSYNRWLAVQNMPWAEYLDRVKLKAGAWSSVDEMHTRRFFHAGSTWESAFAFLRPGSRCECGAEQRRHVDGGKICADRCDLVLGPDEEDVARHEGLGRRDV